MIWSDVLVSDCKGRTALTQSDRTASNKIHSIAFLNIINFHTHYSLYIFHISLFLSLFLFLSLSLPLSLPFIYFYLLSLSALTLSSTPNAMFASEDICTVNEALYFNGTHFIRARTSVLHCS